MPLACPPSGFLCPGVDADGVNTPPGSLPIQLPVGGISTERQVVREVLQLRTTLTLNADVDSVDVSALKEPLARLYYARAEDVAVSLGGGSVVVTVGLAASTQDAVAQLHDAINITSDAELSLALGMNATRQPDIRIGSVNITRTEIVKAACPPGSWCSAGYTYPCESGTFNPVADADSASACTLCAPGKYNPLQGQSSAASCLACPEGTANPKPGGAGLDACVRCATGTFAGSNGSDACLPCSPGTYSDQIGATTCAICEPGYYCTTETPIMCSQNTYNPNPGAYLSTNCTGCPGRFTSTLGFEGRTSIDDCACSRTFFLAPLTMNLTGMEDECEERCCACPIGTDCPGGVTLANMRVIPGYYRRSPDQLDVRRCPDASTNCRPGESICADSTSACRGGRNATNATSEMCHPGLTGVFCRACVEHFEFFVQAEKGVDAHCEPCENAVSSGLWIGAVIAIVGIVTILVMAAAARYYNHHVRRLDFQRIWTLLVDTYSVPNKIKILIASYQIMTKIEDVYEVNMPPAVRALLQQLRIGISLGIEGYPLACVGANGYHKRLLLWTFMPLVLVLLAILAVMIDVPLRQRKQVTILLLFQNAMPAVLRIAFILYPIVTNVAFEAFSCFSFEDGRSWLIADVNIECHTAAHTQVTLLAGIAVAVYPVGLLLLNALILYRARNAIRLNQPTTLSNAARFLYAEYDRRYFWWELMEMGRRFLLVGLYVIFPFRQGSIMQVAVANLTAVIFLVLQLEVKPYRNPFDDYLAVGCSLSLVVMLLCTIFYKYISLTELPGIRNRMSLELKNDYYVEGVLLSTMFIICVFGGLVLSALITAQQIATTIKNNAKLRRLKYTATGKWVECKHVTKPQSFHLFLSHAWRPNEAGEDAMRMIKVTLLEILPGSKVFLDKDDVDQLGTKKPDEFVNESAVVLAFVTSGYLQSKPCAKELCRAVLQGKPVIAVLEPEVKRGGQSKKEIEGILNDNWLEQFKLSNEMQKWRGEPTWPENAKYDALPTVAEIKAALFKERPIEWNTITIFRDVTMRLIAERVLGLSDGTCYPEGTCYLQGEMERTQVNVQKPSHERGFHFYSSQYNASANVLVAELMDVIGNDKLLVTHDYDQLDSCDHFLLHLTDQTWAGEASAQLAREVCNAMRKGVHLLCAHEFPSNVGDVSELGSCPFSLFFQVTPRHLLEAGIYKQIASPLKPAPWRKAGLVQLALKVVESGGDRKQWKADVEEPLGTDEWQFTPLPAPSDIPPPPPGVGLTDTFESIGLPPTLGEAAKTVATMERVTNAMEPMIYLPVAAVQGETSSPLPHLIVRSLTNRFKGFLSPSPPGDEKQSPPSPKPLPPPPIDMEASEAQEAGMVISDRTQSEHLRPNLNA